jgi:exopolyphosphatase/guanosine-5'-triphosphate,3'-diphosphate pyrophosphatase
MTVSDPSSPHEAAVVDIGSNSVRLVIYRLEGRAIWTVFNEKVLAGLGRGVEQSGRLSPEGVRDATTALRRFKAVLDAAKPAAVYVAATAAVREAADGPDFVRLIERETGLRIRVLSGVEEGRFSALGVLSGHPDAEGVVGDLGGSSLELVRIGEGEAGAGVTLPLGPFALGAPKPFEASRVHAAIAQTLEGTADGFHSAEFHAVGGAWRALALIHMAMVDYPLQIVHQYEISGRAVGEVARFVAKQSRASLERIPGVAKKRVETLPYAAALMEALVDRLGFERLTVSAYGLREGLLFDAMSPALRQRDPLIHGCASLGARQGVAEGLGESLADWLRPTFLALTPEFPGVREAVLVDAACRLADVGARLHPDHRAELAFAQVLRAPIAGQTHAERAFLALAVHARYGGPPTPPEPVVVARLLTEERQLRARALGLAMRLGCDLSGRTAALLAQSTLAVDGDRLVLTARPDWADMLLGEQTAKRASVLAGALRLELEMRTVV